MKTFFLFDLFINQLPLYPERREKPDVVKKLEEQRDFEESIRSVRHRITERLSFLGDAFQVSRGYYEHGIGKSKQLYDNLIDEKEQTTKIVAITTGGLLGLGLSFRKGLFKKLIYTTTFSAAVASICYPKLAKEYAEIAGYITKNKVHPIFKEYTGVDLNEKFKGLKDNLPDLSSVKNLWNWNDEKKKASSESTENVSKDKNN